jgi:hypothetical protein
MIWISFSYWGLCELLDDSLRECTAIDLIYLEYSSKLSMTTPDLSDNLYCSGPFCVKMGTQIWGKDFVSYGLHGQSLWMSLGKSQDHSSVFYLGCLRNSTLFVFQYNIYFYKSGDVRRDDYPLTLLTTVHNVKGVLSFQYSMSSLYTKLLLIDNFGIYSDILLWSLIYEDWYFLKDIFFHILNGLGSKSLSETDVNIYDLITSQNTLVQFLSSHLLWFKGTSFILDLSNFFISDESIFKHTTGIPDMISFKSGASSLYLAKSPSHITIFKNNLIQLCQFNHVHFNDINFNDCQKSICSLSKESCGPNSFRNQVSGSCECDIGYVFSSFYLSKRILQDQLSFFPLMNKNPLRDNICIACKSNHFCPGKHLSEFTFACPENSFSSILASSILDCHCFPGFFHLNGKCILCPTNMWCPFNGTVVPIPCNGIGSTTLYEGASNPLECSCDKRRFGIHCELCNEQSDCVTYNQMSVSGISITIPQLFAVHVQGWSGYLGSEIMNECVFSLNYADTQSIQIYPISNEDFFVFKSLQNESYTFFREALLLWNWIFILKGELLYISFQKDLKYCMEHRGFIFDHRAEHITDTTSFNLLASQRAFNVRVERSCGNKYWEWNGDFSGLIGSCTCIAGYEPIKTIDWNLQCFPCINGTHRPRHFNGGCIPCSGTNEEAPYLGMSECICKGGYLRHRDGTCHLDAQYVPYWYSVLHTPLIFISICVCVCLLIFFIFIFMGLKQSRTTTKSFKTV